MISKLYARLDYLDNFEACMAYCAVSEYFALFADCYIGPLTRPQKIQHTNHSYPITKLQLWPSFLSKLGTLK